MQGMDDADLRELSLLRTRAYGPDADIERDPDALARLRALEERRRTQAPVTPAATPAPAAGAAVETAPEDGGAPPPRPTEAPAAMPPRIGRALAIGWAASIAVVAVVVGALVFGLASLRPVSPVTGARQVASLDEPLTSPPAAMPWFGESEDSSAYAFSGLVVVAVARDVLDSSGECLIVTPRVPAADGSRFGTSGCGAGPFHPTVALLVADDSPEELRAAFPVGTALQFVWDGDAVAVFAADPQGPTAAPA